MSGALYAPSSVIRTSNLRLPDGDPTSLAVYRELYDRLHVAGTMARGALLQAPAVYNVAGGSSGDPRIHVGPVRRLVVYDTSDAVWRMFEGVADDEAIPGGNLAADTWYYVAAEAQAGFLTYVITGNPPGADLVLDSVGRRYLGCLRTDGAGAPIPFRSRAGRFWYRHSVPGGVVAATDTRSDSNWHALSLASRVPPHAQLAHVLITLSGGGGGGSAWRSAADANPTNDSGPASLLLDQAFEWNANGSSGGINVIVHAFEEV